MHYNINRNVGNGRNMVSPQQIRNLNLSSNTQKKYQIADFFREAFVLEQLKNICMNQYRDNEPLDITDISIPWKSNKDAVGHITFIPFEELDAIALADYNAGKKREAEVIDPIKYINAVTNRYFYTERDQCECVSFYSFMLNQIESYCKEFKIPTLENVILPKTLRALGVRRVKNTGRNVHIKPTKSGVTLLNFEKCAPQGIIKIGSAKYSFERKAGAELVKLCFHDLYCRFAIIIAHYYNLAYSDYIEEANDTTNVAA